ncbi:MAG: polysaccharide biosynthesis tyrosine autokinase, partial [Desulfobulbaceae bacterium]|nr:polysaccharide biosynthesis tyrosine autokinase [Desulfobulbaceae bacterium]
ELARSNEENIRNLLGSTRQEAMSLNEKFVQYGILKREVETNKALYEALNMRIKEQGVTEETQKLNVWITAEAERPGSPVKPQKKRNIMLGIILGLFGGIGIAFFIEYLDNTIKNPDEAEARLDLSVVGVIELIKKKQGLDIEKASWQEPKSSFAESMKSLRTAILLSSADSPPKRLLITSMQPQEGKTTISTNLALTIAQNDYKVLLVDADLRRPSIHKVFGIDNSKGLSSYLAGAADEGITHFFQDENLSIIPSGPLPPNPSELLGSNRLKKLIKSAGEKFDFVIIDSPPSMSATDSLILSKVVDRTLIVSRAGKTTYEVLDKGLKSFIEINARILGMVINAMDMKKTKYHYYYGYYNYYSDEKEERGKRLEERG